MLRCEPILLTTYRLIVSALLGWVLEMAVCSIIIEVLYSLYLMLDHLNR